MKEKKDFQPVHPAQVIRGLLTRAGEQVNLKPFSHAAVLIGLYAHADNAFVPADKLEQGIISFKGTVSHSQLAAFCSCSVSAIKSRLNELRAHSLVCWAQAKYGVRFTVHVGFPVSTTDINELATLQAEVATSESEIATSLSQVATRVAALSSLAYKTTGDTGGCAACYLLQTEMKKHPAVLSGQSVAEPRTLPEVSVKERGAALAVLRDLSDEEFDLLSEELGIGAGPYQIRFHNTWDTYYEFPNCKAAKLPDWALEPSDTLSAEPARPMPPPNWAELQPPYPLPSLENWNLALPLDNPIWKASEVQAVLLYHYYENKDPWVRDGMCEAFLRNEDCVHALMDRAPAKRWRAYAKEYGADWEVVASRRFERLYSDDETLEKMKSRSQRVNELVKKWKIEKQARTNRHEQDEEA